jgi:ribosomal protein L13
MFHKKHFIFAQKITKMTAKEKTKRFTKALAVHEDVHGMFKEEHLHYMNVKKNPEMSVNEAVKMMIEELRELRQKLG